ncbi:MAG: circularly permuted type 2 ATP-grasp protein [Bacteroidota bacterium]|nr:circularly permuted type 2 ATP-grasp protein [Bacteroidota bacterium]
MKKSNLTLDSNIFEGYHVLDKQFDEVYLQQNKSRPHYQSLIIDFARHSLEDFRELNEYARDSFYNQGITFNVYSDKSKGVERIFPFDLFPRVIPFQEWQMIEKGLLQRNQAINLFLYDLYHDQKILKDKIVPSELILSCAFFNKHMIGIDPPGGIYVHIAGTDLIRHSDGDYYILEDNVRCPSGVSYVLSNRETMKRTLPNLFLDHSVQSVQEYPEELLNIMHSVAPKQSGDNPTCVILTPGAYNSAYYEHSFLALWMGIQLVEGRDLFVDKNFVYMKTIYGPKKVDIIYRRIDDDFLDPQVFRPDSVLGIPGIMQAYREGNVSILNAPGTGAADDKAVYIYMPEIIKYYLNETPILKNVPTYRCELDADYKYVIENMDKLVIKPVDESGGYGVVIGPNSTKEELEKLKKVVASNRRKYIAQPVMNLSMHSTYIDEDGSFSPRHVDLRTFCLMGKNRHYVLKGGLTRVALKKGSLIVNSSQGGGSKDTWITSN